MFIEWVNGTKYSMVRGNINAMLLELFTNKLEAADVLTRNNTSPYSPVDIYNPATKGYIDGLFVDWQEVFNPGNVNADIFNRANHVGMLGAEYITQDANYRFVSDAEKTSWNGKEPAIGAKGSAFNKAFGTVAGTVAEGDHSHINQYEAKNVNIQTHIATAGNPHGLVKADIALGNVDNTSDANKPVSNAVAVQLALKADKDVTQLNINSVAALKAAGSSQPILYMSGRATPGDGAEGFFRYVLGNYTAQVTADPLNGVYVPLNEDPTGLVGCRIRQALPGIAIPDWWGTDALAIQYAIDFLSAGDVILQRMYTINRRVPITARSCDAMIVPKTNVNIIGRGFGTGVKVADGVTLSGDYVVFCPASLQEVNNTRFENFCVDGNAINNLHPSGSVIRRAFAIWLFKSDRTKVKNVLFINNPGYNTVKLGDDAIARESSNAEIDGNYFVYQGGAIASNRECRDHSTIYISGRGCTVSKNKMLGSDTVVDETTAPTVVVCAIEMHGHDHQITHNLIKNYGSIGYSVADGIYDSSNHVWQGNVAIDMTKIGISLWSVTPMKNIKILDNIIKLDHTLNQAVAGIFQSIYTPDTTYGVNNLDVKGNTIYSEATVTYTHWVGISLCAGRQIRIHDNTFDRISMAAIQLTMHNSLPLDLIDVSVKNNKLKDACILGEAWYFTITNNGSGVFKNITIGGNEFINDISSARQVHGLNIQATGLMSNIRITNDNTFRDMPNRDTWVGVGATLSLNADVVTEPKITSILVGSVPKRGLFMKPYDNFGYLNPYAGNCGAVVGTSGGGYEATRADSTLYTKGQWIRTTAGKVLECKVGGTSGTGDPAPTVLGSEVTDGGVTWIYRSATSVTIVNFG